jgi:hypothetical protein
MSPTHSEDNQILDNKQTLDTSVFLARRKLMHSSRPPKLSLVAVTGLRVAVKSRDTVYRAPRVNM